MRNYDIKINEIKPHNILFAVTSPESYEMERLILLEEMPDIKYGEFILVEGYHCSCYDFDSTKWEATVYSHEELNNLLKKDYDSTFEYTRTALQKFWRQYI